MRTKLNIFAAVLSMTSLCSSAKYGNKYQKENLLPPVIIVPGDGGSQIEAKLDKPSTVHYVCTQKSSDYFDLWLNMELLAPYVIDCWVDNMKLIYNKTTRKTTNNHGVETRVPGFGDSETVEWLDPSHRYPTGYFKDIANALIPLGYERGTTIRGAPFDFRKAPNELGDYFLQLRRLTEETYQTTGQKVVFVAHSMGGPILHVFLNQQSQHWKDKHIRSFVSLAGAFGGAIKAMKVFASGDNLGIYVIPTKSLREEQRASPSLAFLLPNSEIWGPDYILAQTPTANYTTANWDDFFRDLNLPDAYEMYLDTKDFLLNAPPPGVEVHCLHGIGVQTVERMDFAAGKFPDTPKVKYGDGDGTVNVLSAHRCLQWNNTQNHQVYHKEYKGVDHMAILRNEEPVNYIVNVIKKITAENQWERDMINGLKKLAGQEKKLTVDGEDKKLIGEDKKLQSEDKKLVGEDKKITVKEDIKLKAEINEATESKNNRKPEKSIEEFVVEVEEKMSKNNFRLAKEFRSKREKIEKKMEKEYQEIGINVL